MAVASGTMQPQCDSAEPALSHRPSTMYHKLQQQIQQIYHATLTSALLLVVVVVLLSELAV